MSGGALDYVYNDVRDAINEGVYDVDDEQAELVDDIAGILHDVEWSASGDYSRDAWRSTLAELTAKWEGGYKSDNTDMGDIDIIAPLGYDEETARNVKEANSGTEDTVVVQLLDDGQYFLVRWPVDE